MARIVCSWAVSVVAAITCHANAWSTPLTLNTTWLDANATMTFSSTVLQSLSVTGIQVSAGGKATEVRSGVLNLPVSEATLDIKLLPPSLSIAKAQVDGVSLDFYNTLNKSKVSLADLDIDFKTNLIMGNVVTSKGSVLAPLLTFSVTKPLTFDLKGGIAFNLGLGNLHFTDEGAQRFADAVQLPAFMVPVLKQLDFGTIDTKVTPWFRKPVAAIPEPSTNALFLLGFCGLALMHRKGRRPHRSIVGKQ
jgi:PEP-CTERM motif